MLAKESSVELLAQGLQLARGIKHNSEKNNARPTTGTAPSRFARRCGGALILALSVGTGGAATFDYVTIRDGKGYRLNEVKYAERTTPPRTRSAAEDIAYVRETLKPPVTELAQLFGVSRQAIYNWQAGEALAERNQAQLLELVKATNLLQERRISNTSSVIKRKLPGGKSMLEMMRDGEKGESAAMLLVNMITKEQEQRERMEARLKNRGRPKVDLADAGAPYGGLRT